MSNKPKRNRRKLTEVNAQIVYYPCHAGGKPFLGLTGWLIPALRYGRVVGTAFTANKTAALIHGGSKDEYQITDILHLCYRGTRHPQYETGSPSWDEGDFCIVLVEKI